MAAQPPVSRKGYSSNLRVLSDTTVSNRRYRARSMITTALRPVGHIAAWLVWHSTGISLLADLDGPAASRSE